MHDSVGVSDTGVWAALRALCAATVPAASVGGAAVSLLTAGGHAGLVHATDATAVRLDEVQFALGEGPTREAFERGRPVLIADLSAGTGDMSASRWPMFTAAALTAGARAVFAVPLQLGAIRVGVLLLYRREPGGLDAAELAAILRNADAMTVALVNLPRSAPREDADEAGSGGHELVDVGDAVYRAVVHQAVGMVTAQLGISLEEALARLRAHAFANDMPITEVARAVVDRSLRFEA